jgi:MFS transporter, DHA2 family, multidrug resistance protein
MGNDPSIPIRFVNPWIVAVTVMFPTFMEVLDTTVVNVSLPHIAGSLAATVYEATWVLTTYLIANAIILPMTGWLAKYFGRKRLLIIAVSSFTIASFFCGLSPNLPSLLMFRILQGFSGGALQPISQAIMLEAFPPEDRGKAMGFWGVGIVVAPILGPVVGGWLTEEYSWRWVFYINIPVGLISVFLTYRFIFDPSYIRRESRQIDFWGIVLLALGIGCLQIVLDQGQEKDWFGSIEIRILAIAAFIGLLTFVIWELKTKFPVVDLRVLKIPTYAAGVFLMTALGFVLYGSLVLLPILLQTLYGYPSLKAGTAMSPRGIGSLIAMPIVGNALSKLDGRKLLGLGLIGGSLTLFWFGRLNLQAGAWDFFWPQFVQGISLALLFVPLTTVTMHPIAKEEMGNATSIFNLMRNMGGSLGIAAVTTLLDRRQQANFDLLGAKVNPSNVQLRSAYSQLRSGFIGRGKSDMEASRMANAAINALVQRQSSMLSFINVFRLMGLIFLLVLPLVFVMKSTKKGKIRA